MAAAANAKSKNGTATANDARLPSKESKNDAEEKEASLKESLTKKKIEKKLQIRRRNSEGAGATNADWLSNKNNSNGGRDDRRYGKRDGNREGKKDEKKDSKMDAKEDGERDAKKDDNKISVGDGKDRGEDKSKSSAGETKGAPRNNAPRNNAPRNNALRNNAPRNNAPRNNAPRNNAPRNNAPRNDASVKDASVKDASVKDASVKDASVKDASVKDASVKDASVKDASVKDAPRNAPRKDARPEAPQVKADVERRPDSGAKKRAEGASPAAAPGEVESNRGRKRRRRRNRRRRRGRDGPSPHGGGGPINCRDYYRGGPTPGGYRGDPYRRGVPPLREYHDDWRREGWGDDRRGGGGCRDERDFYGRPRDDYWDGPPPPRAGPARRDGDIRGDIYGRGGPLPPRGSGGGSSSKDHGRSPTSRSRSRSPSRSRSYSSRSRHSRSRSGSRSYSSRMSRGRSFSRSPSPSYSRSPSKDSKDVKRQRSDDDGRSRGGQSRSDSSPDKAPAAAATTAEEDSATKDQRTVFVSQLVMRADERDIGRYFRRRARARVRDVILLRDRRTGRHKGCAYVELGSLADVERALGVAGEIPDFQRFPILVKRADAERNSVSEEGAIGAASSSLFVPPVRLAPDGRRIDSQKVYVGSIDRCVTQAQLHSLFSQFGQLDRALLQVDAATGASRGFAFLTYRDPRDANLAIQTMSGQMLAGRPLKTGWANQQASPAGVLEVKSDQFPDDANEKIQRVNAAMNQLTGTSLTTMIGQVDPSAQQALLAAGPAGALGIMPSAQLASVADAALDMALGVTSASNAATIAATTMTTGAVATAASDTAAVTATTSALDARAVCRSEVPTPHILVHNMFDKDEETERGWEEDIRLDFEEECAQYGKIACVVVMSKEPGGKIYASFDDIEGAENCAKNLAGRWFDKRQLRVEFVNSVPDLL